MKKLYLTFLLLFLIAAPVSVFVFDNINIPLPGLFLIISLILIATGIFATSIIFMLKTGRSDKAERKKARVLWYLMAIASSSVLAAYLPVFAGIFSNTDSYNILHMYLYLFGFSCFFALSITFVSHILSVAVYAVKSTMAKKEDNKKLSMEGI